MYVGVKGVEWVGGEECVEVECREWGGSMCREGECEGRECGQRGE